MSIHLRVLATAAIAAGVLASATASAAPPAAQEPGARMASPSRPAKPLQVAALDAAGHEASRPSDSLDAGLLQAPADAADRQGMAAEVNANGAGASSGHDAARRAGSASGWRSLAVSEPGVYGMLLSALAVLGMAARRRRRD